MRLAVVLVTILVPREHHGAGAYGQGTLDEGDGIIGIGGALCRAHRHVVAARLPFRPLGGVVVGIIYGVARQRISRDERGKVEAEGGLIP